MWPMSRPTGRTDAACAEFPDDESTSVPIVFTTWFSGVQRCGPPGLAGRPDGQNVVDVFLGHQHEVPMIYQRAGLDLFKPKAAYMGGFALARVTSNSLDVVLGEAGDD